MIAELKGVEVYVLGVDNAGKDSAYWEGLREFWQEYFRNVGASVESYSVLREFALPR